MFTVCPKCALTLVVTAADLRVAQGYVRCGRCSNVFNALARLSEDRGAAAAASQNAQASTGVHPQPEQGADTLAQPQPSAAPPRQPQATGAFVFTKPADGPASGPAGVSAPAPRAGQAPARPQPTDVSPTGAAPTDAARLATPPAPSVPPPMPPPPSGLLSLDDDDDIPEDALEFNPDADVTQVFVEPPPNPEWTAATGTFKAIVLKSEEIPGPSPAAPKLPTSGPARALGSGAGAAGSGQVFSSEFNSSLQEDEIELDADFLSATAEMRRLKPGAGDPDAGVGGVHKPTPPIAPTPSATTSHAGSPPQPGATPHAGTASYTGAAPNAGATSYTGTTSPAGIASQVGATPHAGAASHVQPTSQAQIAPSARMAPRGPIAAEPLAHASSVHAPPRSIPAEPPSREPPETPTRQQQLTRPGPDAEEVFPEPEVVTRAQPRNAVKAFGLDAVEAPAPPPERLAHGSSGLATLARSRVAHGPVELEPAPALKRALLNSPAMWGAGAGAMAVLLVAQIVNHYRDDLAATTQFNKPITAVYRALGVQLTPHWDLHAYDVRQLGASVDAASAGQIMVRASVKNGASQAQPMPLLRVTLQDRFGNRIAARDVAPGNYLPRATATTFLPAGQRIDAEMAFVDPGANAVGFEIDACLPAPAGGIACANDPVSR
jgi:predicted Zn finger-like uncharacterized protein